MDIPVLKVEARQGEAIGKGPASRMRRKGQVPAVCYGRDLKPLPISVNPDELMAILRRPLGLNSLITLSGAEDRTVFVQEIQRHPVERNIVHVDFVHVDTKLPIRRKVPVEFQGKPEGVKNGGVLQITAREILVEALPTAIPATIVLNVEALNIGQSIHVEEAKLPAGVKALFERNYSICAVVAPTEEKAPEPEVPAEGEVVEGEEGAAPAEGKAPDGKGPEGKGLAGKEEGGKKGEGAAPDKKAPDKKAPEKKEKK